MSSLFDGLDLNDLDEELDREVLAELECRIAHWDDMMQTEAVEDDSAAASPALQSLEAELHQIQHAHDAAAAPQTAARVHRIVISQPVVQHPKPGMFCEDDLEWQHDLSCRKDSPNADLPRHAACACARHLAAASRLAAGHDRYVLLDSCRREPDQAAELPLVEALVD